MKAAACAIIDAVSQKYPFTFIDVGAMGGIPRPWQNLQGLIKVIGFEPDEREFKKLKSNGCVTYFNYALHNKPEDLKYFVTKSPGRSSIFRPNREVLSHFEDIGRFEVVKEEIISSSRIRTLDQALEENAVPDVDFIKVDTQGSELAILEGGQNSALFKTFGIQVEVEFIEMYKNQPLFGDVDGFLRKNSFELMDIKRYYWKRKDYHDYTGKGQLVFGDALYFKNIEALAKMLSEIREEPHRQSKIYKGILTCLIYRMWDYAVLLLNLGRRLKIISEADYKKMFLVVKKASRKGALPCFPGKKVLYGIASRAREKLTPPSYLGWADSDKTIGNIKDV